MGNQAFYSYRKSPSTTISAGLHHLVAIRVNDIFPLRLGSKKGQIWALLQGQIDPRTLGYFHAELVASEKYKAIGQLLKGHLQKFSKKTGSLPFSPFSPKNRRYFSRFDPDPGALPLRKPYDCSSRQINNDLSKILKLPISSSERNTRHEFSSNETNISVRAGWRFALVQPGDQ